MKTILVVEDELSIRTFVSLNLRRKMYRILEAASGEEALRLLSENEIDLVLLDLMLPGIDGFQVCQEIRSQYANTGIIILTARAREEEKIRGLVEGADDYLTKPFSMAELEARILSLLRRMEQFNKVNSTAINSSGPFQIDSKNSIISLAGEAIRLTPTEYCLLQFLIANKNQVFSRNDLLDEIWGINYAGDIKVVDVNIRRIRMKTEKAPSNPEFLVTVWGYGYMWKDKT